MGEREGNGQSESKRVSEKTMEYVCVCPPKISAYCTFSCVCVCVCGLEAFFSLCNPFLSQQVAPLPPYSYQGLKFMFFGSTHQGHGVP